VKDINRKLYGASEDVAIARYTVASSGADKEISLRVYDVVGGDALVFLTDTRAKRLISDLQRAMAARNGGPPVSADLSELCHTIRAFADRLKGERDRAVAKYGHAGAVVARMRATVADELLALLPPEDPR
jgi:hypothetical protein